MNRSAIGAGVRAGAGGPGLALAPLGSAAAFSWTVVMVYCPIGVLIQAPGNASIYGGSVGRWVLASTAGMAFLVGVFAGARSAARRGWEPSSRSVLACYAIAGTVQSVTFGLASVLFGAADSPQLGFRLSGLFLHLPLLSAVGYAVARHDAHVRVRRELEQSRDRLLAIGRTVDSELDRVESELGEAVRRSLEPAVESLDAALANSAGGAGRAGAVAAIDSLIEERVRPLAHGLASDRPSEAEALGRLVEGTGRSRARVPLPTSFCLADAIKPGLVAVASLIAAFATAARELAPLEVLVYLPTISLLAWAIFASIRHILGEARLRTSIGLPAVVAIHSLAGSAAYWLTGAIGVATPTGLALSGAVLYALLGLAIVGELLVEARRTESEVELQAVTVRLEGVISLVRRREHLVRRRLAFVVHGALQGALHSAALRVAESDGLSDRLGLEIRRDIDSALAQVDRRPDPTGGSRTSAAIAELASVWGGHRQFAAQLEPAVEERLSGDIDADEAVAEVVREAVNNAFRHGAAGAVEVKVGLAPVGDGSGAIGRPREIAISVTDDGSGVSGERQPGLGSAMFDDLCREWVLRGDRPGTAFDARVTLDLDAIGGDGPEAVASGVAPTAP